MTAATDPRRTGISNAATLLAASAVAASVTGTISETALATITIPAGAMGLRGGLLIYSNWSLTNSVNNKILRVRLGGIGGTAYLGPTLTTSASFSDMRRIRNRGSAASQVGSMNITNTAGGGGISTGALPTSVIDTSVSVDLVLTGTLANTGETITLENYEVWLTP